ncbi:hypothetical protein H0H81_007290 [Sphagnurus paluster]|uniref:SPRY-domain-containing protein n=1 Tax=Sphagnurus paluster TaxID=117069 RepID=A0A9P7GKL8_9AGAR|nr:hypothetical protein H0H81_007290 [Sphagnurus paluster]
MTTRPTRSASIPIGPRSSSSLSPARTIESVISIPFAAPPRPRIVTAQSVPRSSVVDDHRGTSVSYGTRGSSSVAGATSHARTTARSLSLASVPARAPLRIPAFEPRVVRATTDATRNDAACLPSTSPSRPRRASVGISGRGASVQRPIAGFAPHTAHAAPVAFPRPSYLDHSALRHLLQTDAPPALPPSRKAEPSVAHEPQLPSAVTYSSTTDSDEESNISPPREFLSAPLPAISQDRVLHLPTRWSDQTRHALLSVSPDGRDLTYHGASCSGDRDAAAARTVHHIPPACGIYYYEVEIISKGQKGHISIGFSGRDVKLSRLPGWEVNSWGYHGDDGCSFAAERTGTGTKYGPTFGTGDVIGCGIDFTTHRAFFTKNGTLLGSVFENIGKDIDLYPSIGLRHAGEAVRVNFGHEPFKFDIDFYVLQKRSQVWAQILNTPLPASLPAAIADPEQTPLASVVSDKTALEEGETKEMINKLVMSYLEHHGYVKTVRAFQKQRELPAVSGLGSEDRDVDMASVAPADDTNTDTGATENDMERRTKIVNAVVAGDIDMAIAETRTHHPAVLDAEEGLMLFKLRCRKFIELILEAAELKKRMRRVGAPPGHGDSAVLEEMDGMYADGMDVDDEAPLPSSSGAAAAPTNGFGGPTVVVPLPARRGSGFRRRSSAAAPEGVGMLSQYESALHGAIAYGQGLSNDYKDDVRPEVKTLFKRTFAIVAWEDPAAAGGVVGEVTSHAARVALANELNQAILKSQGRPANPLLETLYRRTAVCITQLALMGVGGATFADMQRDLLDG